MSSNRIIARAKQGPPGPPGAGSRSVVEAGGVYYYSQEGVDGTFQIFSRTGATGAEVQLTTLGANTQPVLGSGPRILFVSDRDGAPAYYSMSLDGSGQSALFAVSTPGALPSVLLFEDGTRVLFEDGSFVLLET